MNQRLSTMCLSANPSLQPLSHSNSLCRANLPSRPSFFDPSSTYRLWSCLVLSGTLSLSSSSCPRSSSSDTPAQGFRSTLGRVDLGRSYRCHDTFAASTSFRKIYTSTLWLMWHHRLPPDFECRFNPVRYTSQESRPSSLQPH